jgi:eukaryotic-like serine/threonine-protein kinase
MTSLSPELEQTYEVLQTMGGGMGAVYKVRHRLFGEIRVIKVMQAALTENQALKDRFSAEAKRGKQLKHRNIAEVLDFQIGSNGNPHLVMEYVDGVNLRDEVVRRGAPLDPESAVRIGVQALAALGYLHDRHLIHRDISPDNLMIARDADGTPLVKLIDLGISKSLEETVALTRAGDFMGKMSYASPEQFSGNADARSDFYSLGVVLYELLTAARPITGTSTAALIMAHCQSPPRPFSETDPTGRVPEALRRAVLKALEKKPEDRYQTAAEFAAALRAAVPTADTTPIARTVTLPPPAPPTVPPLPRRPADVTIVAPRTQRGGNARTFLLFAAVAAGVAVIAFAATALFEKAKARDVAAVAPATTATTSSAQPAGVTIAIEAPDPNRSPPRARHVTVATATAPPPAIIENNATTTAAPIAPATATIAPVLPPPQPSAPSRDLAEGERRRREALAFSNAHRWTEAAPAWRQFIRDYAGSSPAADHAAYYNLGVAYESLQEWRDGADAFERAALADPRNNDTNNLLRLARCYGKLGRLREAATTYERVLKIDPFNDVAKRNLLALQQPRPH